MQAGASSQKAGAIPRLSGAKCAQVQAAVFKRRAPVVTPIQRAAEAVEGVDDAVFHAAHAAQLNFKGVQGAAELDDAPESAHVKRTAQESFSPEAFTVRRSMPWIENGKSGLMFVSFSRTLNAFEVQLRRMSGMEDGIVDALYSFSRPLNGGYYWCPPLKDGRLDLSALRSA